MFIVTDEPKIVVLWILLTACTFPKSFSFEGHLCDTIKYYFLLYVREFTQYNRSKFKFAVNVAYMRLHFWDQSSGGAGGGVRGGAVAPGGHLARHFELLALT